MRSDAIVVPAPGRSLDPDAIVRWARPNTRRADRLAAQRTLLGFPVQDHAPPAVLPSGRLAAQVTSPPTLPPPPSLTLPAVQEARLSNGLRLVVVPMHEVPLVQIVLGVAGGAREDASLPGLATFTANMLDEGAGTRDANGIAAEAAYLGASLFTGADWNATTISLRVPKRTLAPALDLMADVVLRPTFLAPEVKRQRDLRIANLIQQRDVPAAVATLAYNAIVFPEGHPYHRPINGDSASTATLDSATVRAFYQRTMVPERTTVLVTGDITLAEARREIERRFRGIGQGWARFTYGGSTGGWEAMAVQLFYPDEFNGAWIACPDPIDFRAYTVVNIYEDTNAYYATATWKRTPRPGYRDYLGHVRSTLEQMNHRELVLGT